MEVVDGFRTYCMPRRYDSGLMFAVVSSLFYIAFSFNAKLKNVPLHFHRRLNKLLKFS